MKKIHIGSRIKYLIEQRNMTVIELSKVLDMSSTAVYEMFRKEDVNTSVLKKISEKLNTPLSFWFQENEEDYVVNDDVPTYQNEQFLMKQIERKDHQIEILETIIKIKLIDKK